MPTDHCCGLERLFDRKGALKQLRRYKKRGPAKTTRLLIETLKAVDLKGMSLLDIGGGIGAIQFDLLAEGIENVTDVDASEGYLSVAKEEAAHRTVLHQISYLHGDYLDLEKEIDPHDIVTLDKVVCCYPDMDQLLETSLANAKRYYGLVYPRGGWLVKMGMAFGNLMLRIFRNPFSIFQHSPAEIRKKIADKGFKRIAHRQTLNWNIELYVKQDD